MLLTYILSAFVTLQLSVASLREEVEQDEIQPPIWDSFVGLRSQAQTASIFGRSDGSTDVIAPKLFIVSMFAAERAAWPGALGLYANNVTLPGLSSLYPQVHCNKKGDICQIVTGEGQINAASTIAALVASPLFSLENTYFFIAGIAGVNPACGTIGGVSLARYAVQIGLEYLIDPRELSENYTSRSGFVPLGQNAPNGYPSLIYGTEVFELSKSLRDRAYSIMQNARLEDSARARQFRKRFPNAPANEPPSVFKGTVATSDTFWHGANLGSAVSEYVHTLTNGTGSYCMTAQEDNAILESLLRGALAGKLDFARIVIMRTASNFDRPPPDTAAATHLFYEDAGGFALGLANIYNAGRLFVDEVIDNWDEVYRKGIAVENYVGDVFGALKGPFAPDIGRADMHIGAVDSGER